MKFQSSLLALASGLSLSMAQMVTVPDTCTEGFEAGRDEVIYTTPYTYDQVMSIIGSYKNLTWSGNPDNTVTLNGTDNTVGTARTYDVVGAHVIETILIYSKPPNGPYDEVHNTALLTVPTYNVSFYIPYDGTTVTPICDGKASTFNFTAVFCANNATLAAGLLHQVHLGDAMTAAKFLGGANFTSCDALGSSSSSATGSSSSAPTASPSPYTGAAAGRLDALVLSPLAALAAAVMWL